MYLTMANKRTLKRAINSICGELLVETVAASLYGNAPHHGNADAVLFSILQLQANFISRISHVEPGVEPRLYFKDLREKFTSAADEIIGQINYL